MSNEQQGRGAAPEVGEVAAGAVLDSNAEIMKHAAERMLGQTSKVTRFVLRRIPDGPGFVYDATQLATSPDKVRTGVGLAGSIGGGVVGGAIGGPVGSVIGSGLGDTMATEAYDHRDDLARALAATRRWMLDRQAQLLRQ
jgi:hypothetical protein